MKHARNAALSSFNGSPRLLGSTDAYASGAGASSAARRGAQDGWLCKDTPSLSCGGYEHVARGSRDRLKIFETQNSRVLLSTT